MVTLEYNLSRPFPGRWFTPAVLISATAIVGVLTTVNVALTGYETITVFEADFNVTQSHWYDRWLPVRIIKPGTMCDPHVFNVGDSFTTNYELFPWTIESINKANAGDSGIAYSGTTLEGCDVESIYLNGNMRMWTLDVTVVVCCHVEDDFEVHAKTSFSFSSLPGNHSPLPGVLGIDNMKDMGKTRAMVLDVMTQLAATDMGDRMDAAIHATNHASPVVLSVHADFSLCPASLGAAAPCANRPPAINITRAAVILPNTDILQFDASIPTSGLNQPVIDDDTFAPVSNLLQIFHAAIRIDLGNPSPNNLLLNPSVLNTTLISVFPTTATVPSSASRLYHANTHPELFHLDGLLPLHPDGLAQIQVVYLCRFQRQKSPGQAFISVLVATLSMFSSGWAAFMLVATYLAKRNNAANVCDAHLDEYLNCRVGLPPTPRDGSVLSVT